MVDSTNIPLGVGDWHRAIADEPDVFLRNRYYEANPTNVDTQVALISRPRLKRWLTVGPGPIRGIYCQPGSFNDALFVASGSNLYRIDTDETVTLIGSNLFVWSTTSSIEMAATAEIGGTPAYLFFTDGSGLWFYTDDNFAFGTLTATGAIANNDIVVIDTVYYKFTSGSVDTGTPAGTSGSPWLVSLGASNAAALLNLHNAINDDGGVGYSALTTIHPTVTSQDYTATTIVVRFKVAGTTGNVIATTTTGAHLVWGAAMLNQGGAATLSPIVTPDDCSIISLAYIASYVIVVPGEGQKKNGRFYWINPGETTIDPLNFATAERGPDPISAVRAVGDQFWLFGTNTTEIWYPSGNLDAPFLRVQGRLFDRGIWQGTAVQIKDAVLVVDQDGVVYKVEGSPQRISNNSIEERLRYAIKLGTGET